MLRAESALVGLGLLVACEQHGATPATAPVTAERAEPVHIDANLVKELARRRGEPLSRARELAEEDALLAAELGRREPALSRSLERLILARELSRSLLAQAELQGPPTDAEVAELTNERWWQLARPRMVQVVHAVVMSESENQQAAALAERIASAVAQAANAGEFERAAKAVPAEDQQVRVESLPPVAADGRAVNPDKPPPFGPEQRLAPEFAAAAQKLEQVGQLSPVVRTSFGYHVLKALRFVAPLEPSLEERRERLRPEIMQRRAVAEQQRVLAEQRQLSPPHKERSALRSIAQLVVLE